MIFFYYFCFDFLLLFIFSFFYVVFVFVRKKKLEKGVYSRQHSIMTNFISNLEWYAHTVSLSWVLTYYMFCVPWRISIVICFWIVLFYWLTWKRCLVIGIPQMNLSIILFIWCVVQHRKKFFFSKWLCQIMEWHQDCLWIFLLRFSWCLSKFIYQEAESAISAQITYSSYFQLNYANYTVTVSFLFFFK